MKGLLNPVLFDSGWMYLGPNGYYPEIGADNFWPNAVMCSSDAELIFGKLHKKIRITARRYGPGIPFFVVNQGTVLAWKAYPKMVPSGTFGELHGHFMYLMSLKIAESKAFRLLRKNRWTRFCLTVRYK